MSQSKRLHENKALSAINHSGFALIPKHKFSGPVTSDLDRTLRFEDSLYRAKVYLKYFRFEHAKREAIESLDLLESAMGWNLLGIACASLQQLDEARSAFENSAAMTTGNSGAKKNLARIQAEISAKKKLE